MVSARVDLRQADELKPFAGAAELKVYLDGQPVELPVPSSLLAACDGFRPSAGGCDRFVEAGPHEVRLAAVLPGVSQEIPNAEAAVTLDCGQPLSSTRQFLSNESGALLTVAQGTDAAAGLPEADQGSGCGVATKKAPPSGVVTLTFWSLLPLAATRRRYPPGAPAEPRTHGARRPPTSPTNPTSPPLTKGRDYHPSRRGAVERVKVDPRSAAVHQLARLCHGVSHP
jgi:hypothetical protein